MKLFVPLDVDWPSDDKILTAGPLPAYLYLASIAFSKRTLSDGHISQAQLVAVAPGLTGRAVSHAVKLVEAGLWAEAEGGWRIVAWAKHNRTRADVEERSERKRAASTKANHERWHVSGRTSATCPLCDPSRSPSGSGTESTEPEPEPETETEPEPEPETEKRSPPPKGGSKKRDEVWDAVLAVCGIAPEDVLESNRSLIGKVVRDLKHVGATEPEIRKRASIFRGRYPTMTLSPPALAKNWALLVPPAEDPTKEKAEWLT